VLTRRVGDVDYEVAHSDGWGQGGAQIYHLNLLKLWNKEFPVHLATSVIEEGELGPEAQNAAAFMPFHSESHLTLQCGPCRSTLHSSSTASKLTPAVRSHPYRLPENKRKVKEELKAVLEMGVIEESHSAWASLRYGIWGPTWGAEECVRS